MPKASPSSESSVIVRSTLPPLHAAMLDIVRIDQPCATQRVDELLVPLLRIVGRALEISRVAFWQITADHRALELAAQIANDGTVEVGGRRLAAADHQAYFKAMQRSRLLCAGELAGNPATREFHRRVLQPQGIDSALTVPVYAGGTLAGLLTCEQVGPARSFNGPDQHFAVSAADLLALRLQQWEQARLRQELEDRQQLLSAARRSEDLHWLVSGVVHDFKNLLQVALGNLELAEARIEGVPLERVRKAHQALDQAVALMAQLHGYGTRRAPEQARFTLAGLVGSLGPLLAVVAGDQVRLSVQVAGTGQILADRIQVEQILLNLVGNARDAMAQGGRLAVEVRDEPGLVVLTVSDTGSGMTAEVRARLFEPFFTTKPPGHGTGLGLATVKRIVEAMGGEIVVQSEPGQGSTFTVMLPIAP